LYHYTVVSFGYDWSDNVLPGTGEERPYRRLSDAALKRKLAAAEKAAKDWGREQDRLRGYGNEDGAHAAFLEHTHHSQEATALRRERTLREQLPLGQEGLPPAITEWFATMGARPSTHVQYTWSYNGSRIFGVVNADGTLQAWVQVIRRTAGATKLGPTWVLPANTPEEYQHAMLMQEQARS
jgi:hypothetical protein